MLIEVKYAIGDKVRFRHGVTIVDKDHCSFCDGEGVIRSLFDGTEEECPRCDGKGYTEHEYEGSVEDIETIRDIQVYYYGENDKEPYVLYRMSGWKWSQTWIAESQILEVILHGNDN